MLKNEYNDKMISILRQMSYTELPVGAVYISKHLNIPQATVGRMLKQLEKDGMVQRIGGKGRMITAEGQSYLEEYEKRMAHWEMMTHFLNIYDGVPRERLLEIMDVRMLLEGKTAELACYNGTEDQRRDLEKTLLEYKLKLANGGLGSEQDRKLHLTIASMSGNRTLYNICSLILTQDDAYMEFSARAENLKTTHTRQHEAIVKAIIAKDPVKEKEAMLQHLSQVRDDVARNYWHGGI